MKAYSFYRTLTLEGNTYANGDLVALCARKLTDHQTASWERSLFTFLQSWCNDEPAIPATTSGTTGNPKNISIEKNKMLQSARMTLNFLKIPPGSTALLCLSCDYIAGKMMVVRALAGNLNLIAVRPTANPLEASGLPAIDFTALVPMQAETILSNPVTTERFIHINHVLIGGAPLSDTLTRQLAALPNAIYETYGMTETLSHIALKRLSAAHYFETLDDISLSLDQRGCLVIHAPFLGPEPIFTNDLAELMDSRHFRWLGRLDYVINSGGVKIIPEKVEAKIKSLIPERYFITGLPDSRLGEKVALVIESVPYVPERLLQLKKQLADCLGKYEVPREILFVEAFAETASGKIARQKTLSRSKPAG